MHQVAHVLDAVILGATMLSAAAASAVMLSDDPAKNTVELQLFLLPFIGALVVSGGFIMLNPNPETRRITIGRGIFALFFGITLPQVVGLFHPALQDLSVKPVVLVLLGGCVAGLAYVLSKPFTRGMYERSERIAKRELDRMEQRHFPGVEPEQTKHDT